MLYDRYQAARDAAWRTLIQYKVCSLPVDVERIAGEVGVEITAWPRKEETPELFALLPGEAAAAGLRIRGKWHVFTKPGLGYNRYRFALAHELGHIILQHPMRRLKEGVYAFAGRENAGDVLAEAKEESDTDADMFAIRLLAPACVLHHLHIRNEALLSALCGLPERAAVLRAERMALLDSRNAYGIHPLEKQVQSQFAPFIRKKRQEQVPEKAMPERPAANLVLPGLPERPEKKPLPLWVLAVSAAALIALGFLLFGN